MSLNEQIAYENGFGSWPWKVDVDMNNSDPEFYGTNLCGTIAYTIDGPEGLVTLSPEGILYFEPTVDHPA